MGKLESGGFCGELEDAAGRGTMGTEWIGTELGWQRYGPLGVNPAGEIGGNSRAGQILALRTSAEADRLKEMDAHEVSKGRGRALPGRGNGCLSMVRFPQIAQTRRSIPVRRKTRSRQVGAEVEQGGAGRSIPSSR